jgi:uncharacterized membrane protein YagU involved in acid resistance
MSRNDLTGKGRSVAVSPAASAAAGLVGGLVASWLMVAFQRRVWPPPEGDGGESSTTKLARDVAGPLGHGPLTDAAARTAGSTIHYALGAGLGLAYGAAVAYRPAASAGAGMAFGLATEIVIDQAVVPAFGLANPFWKCPPSWHIRGLAAHLLFGAATDATRRGLLALATAAQHRQR